MHRSGAYPITSDYGAGAVKGNFLGLISPDTGGVDASAVLSDGFSVDCPFESTVGADSNKTMPEKGEEQDGNSYS
jgi:hypothetical protein